MTISARAIRMEEKTHVKGRKKCVSLIGQAAPPQPCSYDRMYLRTKAIFLQPFIIGLERMI
ncbi:MAG: hypothetical protein A2Y14_00185 [Verrucomicrobia bacterium GWF2_51_19]|nr:MAG: hypothetical protein A2Y14_00185 [Verrucomicrobia bacterium GWF2_51_19]